MKSFQAELKIDNAFVNRVDYDSTASDMDAAH